MVVSKQAELVATLNGRIQRLRGLKHDLDACEALPRPVTACVSRLRNLRYPCGPHARVRVLSAIAGI